jgi:hypothetical protein
MLDHAFLRTVAAIGGWVSLFEIDALRILPTEAETVVAALVEEGAIEHDVAAQTVRLTIKGLRQITPGAAS